MSEIRANTISDAAGTGPVTLTKQSAAKGYFYIDSPPTIIGSFNVSSTVDDAVGKTTINWTNAFAAADYAVPMASDGNDTFALFNSLGTTSVAAWTFDDSVAGYQDRGVTGTATGDLA